MAATAGPAAAALHSGILDTPRWRLWWICLLLALWPPSDPSYWETSVCDWPRPNTLPHSHTHWLKHTRFLWPLLHATPLIPIGLSLWLQIFFTCSWHPPRSSWISAATTNAHDSLYSGVKNHRILSTGYLLTWFVKLFRPQVRLQRRVAPCVGRKKSDPPRATFDGSSIVSTTQSAGKTVKRQSATDTGSLSKWQSSEVFALHTWTNRMRWLQCTNKDQCSQYRTHLWRLTERIMKKTVKHVTVNDHVYMHTIFQLYWNIPIMLWLM